MAPALEALVAVLCELPNRIAAVGLEGGPLSRGRYKAMTYAGFKAVLMGARLIRSGDTATP